MLQLKVRLDFAVDGLVVGFPRRELYNALNAFQPFVEKFGKKCVVAFEVYPLISCDNLPNFLLRTPLVVTVRKSIMLFFGMMYRFPNCNTSIVILQCQRALPADGIDLTAHLYYNITWKNIKYSRGIFMYKNYVFDLYGTLADIHTDEWKPSLWENTARFYSEHGAPYNSEELHREYGQFVDEETAATKKRHPEYEYVDIQIDKVFRKLYAIKGINADDKLVEETARAFRTDSREYIKLYEGIYDLLCELKKHGKVYLLTNAQRAFTWDELGILGIRDIFDAIVISSDEECCKPDIHFYNTLIERYDLDPAGTIMIGNDPVTDVRGGMSAGFDTLYIHTNISPAIDRSTGCTIFIPDGNTTKMKGLLI